MKIGFFGTPLIASYCLEKLADKHDILFTVTPEDRPSGRDLTIRMCPAKETSLALGIPVLQPESLLSEDFLTELKGFATDIYVIVAYGKIIPKAVYEYPPLKTINLHPSLLPRYRGAAPVQWALINGDRETGVTVQRINDRLDSGDIIVQEAISIDENWNSEDLFNAAIPIGSRLLDEAIEQISSGNARPVVQNEAEATYCGKIDREKARVNWARPSAEIHNLVRGLNPKPCAWTTFRNRNMKIWKTAIPSDISDLSPQPGELVQHEKKRLIVGTGSGVIEILELQQENKGRMNGLAFLNGCRLLGCENFV